MSFLTLQGIDIPVAWGGARNSQVWVGGADTRGLNGTLRRGARAKKREWQLRTPPVNADLVRTYRGLINGEGFHMPFDANSPHATNGLRATVGGSPVYGPDGRIGGYASFVSGSGATWATRLYDEGTDAPWTVIVDKFNGSTFDTYIITSAVHAYKNGIEGSYATLYPESALGIDGVGNVVVGPYYGLPAALYDEMVVLPFQLTAAQAAQAHGWINTINPWGNLPAQTAYGPMVNGTSAWRTVRVIGEVTGSEMTEFRVGGVMTVHESIDFVLREV